MKISIFTVCFNSRETIEDTIKSVLGQDYADLEYIVIDGGSTDGTLDIIKKYQSKIAKVISEPDCGIYDAMNKGIRLSTGEVVGIINSDDFYFDSRVLSEVAASFEQNFSADACYGDVVYVDRKDIKKEVRSWRAGEYDEKKLKNGWIPPHPVFFVKKKIYEQHGLFNTNFKIAADYELMFRFFKRGLKTVYINKKLVKMRSGGHSAKTLGQRLAGWNELKQAWKVNNLKLPKFFIFRRILFKVHQYFIH